VRTNSGSAIDHKKEIKDEKNMFFENLKKIGLRRTDETGTNIVLPDVAAFAKDERLSPILCVP
jgi:hypothetical protein